MKFRNKTLSLNSPQVMGILNVTPDSFSDGGKFNHMDAALAQAEQMVKDGATILDIGGESTRPGAEDVPEALELQRVIPIIEALSTRFDVVLSIDTSKAVVMREAVVAGADLINDVCALQLEGALQVAAETDAAICLMHMQGQPRTMQLSPEYENVIQDVKAFLQQRMQACIDSGISKDRLIIDPGFGFGKTLQHNCDLLAGISRFHDLRAPVLVGVSRKSMFGALLGRDVNERLVPSVVAAVLAAQQGAAILRVHDVKETVDALKLLSITQR
ncbi:dihydropteroate synthase [Paraneptunicella aestuarii]|uniref:dihydropteroate synthase n=1 Tax=Paraneptunicella aestuarii TaxID=2831148 RepID=UPI001E295D33|nr:dihydropteroate synthase [Paraneptunicella aestuarii]UAA39894.1 dihydropteroate synthase [Paraneptunicella aestuarii]